MAEVTISHFKEFPEPERIAFKGLTKGAVAKFVYRVNYPSEVLPPNGITVITHNLGPDSETDSTSGTEVKVALDAEEWPTDGAGQRISPELLCVRDANLAENIGVYLLGGVMREPNASVSVWVQQFAVTGWYEG